MEAGAEEEELPLLELMRSSIIVHRFIFSCGRVS